MEPTYHLLSLATLETVNRVARAAHLWIRHKQTSPPFNPSTTAAQAQDHHVLAAGVISGLCDALLLDGQHALLSAYAYALLDGEDEQALSTARALSTERRTIAEAAAFRDGKLVALDIIAVVQFEFPVDALSVDLHPEMAGDGIAGSTGNH
jgi:hypothetical protein